MDDIEQLYTEICSLCKLGVLEQSVCVDKLELFAFQNRCDELFKLYCLLKQCPTVEQRFCEDCFEDESITLSDAIKGAYHSVLFADTLDDEDSYFLEKGSCSLLDWSESVNPYSDLQTFSSNFVRKQDIRFMDFQYMFTELRCILTKYLSDETLLDRLKFFLQKFETKDLRCNRQFLEQY